MQFTSLKLVVFYIIAARYLFGGIEEYFVIPTAWYYIKSLGQTMSFLGIVLFSFPLASLLSAPIVGKFADKFGYVKCIILTSFTLKVTSNLVYAIPISAYFPLVGRTFSGMADSAAGVLAGQAMLFTPRRYRAKLLFLLGGLYTTGALCGPAISSFLVFNVDVLGWKIDAGNSPGVILALLWGAELIASLWLPRDFGKTETIEDDDDNDNGEKEVPATQREDHPQHPGSLSQICFCFYNVFVGLIFSSTVTFYVPLLAQNHFHILFIHVKLLFLVSTTFYLVLFLGLYIVAGHVSETKLLILAMPVQVCAIIIFTYFAFCWDCAQAVHDWYILIPYICLGMPSLSFILGCSILSKITHPKDAAFFQGSSFTAYHSGYMVSRLISGFVFTKLSLLVLSLVLILLWSVQVIWFALEYRSLYSLTRTKNK